MMGTRLQAWHANCNDSLLLLLLLLLAVLRGGTMY
jgi:hypothetical protein